MPLCPHCQGKLVQTITTYQIEPRPDGFWECQSCNRHYARYRGSPGEPDLFAWLTESQEEPWDKFVARKWREVRGKK